MPRDHWFSWVLNDCVPSRDQLGIIPLDSYLAISLQSLSGMPLKNKMPQRCPALRLAFFRSGAQRCSAQTRLLVAAAVPLVLDENTVVVP